MDKKMQEEKIKDNLLRENGIVKRINKYKVNKINNK